MAYLRDGNDIYDGMGAGWLPGPNDNFPSQFVFGGAGADRIVGSRGNDVLVGGSGDGMLVGYDGDDILIGGTGGDNLRGNRGNDLMVGGSTESDDDLSALDRALAAWSSDDLTSALKHIGHVTDDDEKDDLFGEQGNDYLHYGNGDKRKN